MKKILSMVIVLSSVGLACAGELETAAAKGLTGIELPALKGIEVPAPELKAVKPNPASWVRAVKGAYEKLNEGNDGVHGLPGVEAWELPAGARKQLENDNKAWGPDYPSTAHAMKVQGKTVYIIQNENDGGMFVNIFDENGKKIAGGSCGESGTFGWSKDFSLDLDQNRNASVFQGQSSWSATNGFSALEQLGVRKAAEERAVSKCQSQGLLGCVAIGSTLGTCNTYTCEATGTAFQLVPVAGASVYTANSSWNGSNGFSALEQMGVRKDAEERAISKCQASGQLTCVAIGSNIDTCNTYTCGATGMAQAQTEPK